MDAAERLMFEGWASLPKFDQKVRSAKATIQRALEIAPAFVACSWGKDSIVLTHLCQQIKPDILVAHYGSPESHSGINGNFPEVIKRYLEKNPTNYKEQIGLPEWAATPDSTQSRVSRIVGDKYKLAFVGLRQEESLARKISLKRYGLIHQYQSGDFAGYWRCCPLAYWSWRDVWAYIVANDLPYLDSYDYQDKKISRTNPHSRFWFSQDWTIVDNQREVVKRYNPTLHRYLEDNPI